jgi:hypothetical protein
LVWQADNVGQLLNAGLAVVQGIEQSNPVRLGQDPETLCGEIDNVPRQWLALASRSSRRVMFSCFLHAPPSIRRGPPGQLRKKLPDLAGSFDREVMVVRAKAQRSVCLEASD